MIYTSYQLFRDNFASAGAPVNSLTGYKEWPSDMIGYSEFLPPITPNYIPRLFSFVLIAEANVSVFSDTTYGVDHYDWYVSQRTDSSGQMLSIIQYPSTTTSSFSGAINIAPTYDAYVQLGFDPLAEVLGAGVYTENMAWRLLNGVTVFVKRLSDGAIQYVRPSDTIIQSRIKVL